MEYLGGADRSSAPICDVACRAGAIFRGRPYYYIRPCAKPDVQQQTVMRPVTTMQRNYRDTRALYRSTEDVNW